MNDARLQVAFGGLHPDRVRGLYEQHGPVGTLRRLEKGAIETTDRVRQAVTVSAEARRAELATSGIDFVFRALEKMSLKQMASGRRSTPGHVFLPPLFSRR